MNQLTHHSTAPAFAEIDITSISAFTDRFIKDMKSKVIFTDKGVEFKDSTVRQYKMFYDHLIKFEELHDREFQFAEINYQFAEKFKIYLSGQGLTLNSISNLLKKFKAIMALACRKGLCFYSGSGIKTPIEITPKIYLTLDDLHKMNQAELTEAEAVIRDIFFVQCFTSFRFETLQKFLKSPIAYIKQDGNNSYISIISDKTGQESCVPLGKTVSDIISKYNGSILNYSEEHVNRTIKIIGKKAELNTLVPTRITRGGKLIETLVEKHTQISTHTARRTLISLLKQQKGVTISEILTISGHATQQQMEKYDRSSSSDKIKNLIGHSFFDLKF